MSSSGQGPPHPFRYSAGSPLIIRSITKIHPGLGRGAGAVDLPVQRDELGFPVIYASSLKGSIKSTAWLKVRGKTDDDKEVKKFKLIFGPDPQLDESSGGGSRGKGLFDSSVMFLDAFLLFMPIRSLKGVYVYVTFPHAIENLVEMLKTLKGISSGDGCNILDKIEKLSLDSGSIPTSGTAAIANDMNRVALEANGGKWIVLNDNMVFELDTSKGGEALKILREFLSERVPSSKNVPLLLLNDEDARLVIERGLQVVTRVALETRDKGIKRVKKGALWTTEYIPRGSIFFSLMLAKPPSPRALKELFGDEQSDLSDAEKVLKEVKEYTKYVILGGDETVGAGIVELQTDCKSTSGNGGQNQAQNSGGGD